MVDLPGKTRASLILQREIGRLLSPMWVPLSIALMRFGLGYRIRDAAAVRRRYRELLRASDRPLLLCANHLTMADSALVAWALGGFWFYLVRFSRMPWNLPEYHNFAFLWINRALAYMAKCIPVVRGGSRQDVSRVLKSVHWLLERGEAALMFPEGGRSRTGRVRTDAPAQGVGRTLSAVEGCRVLCIYLRGEGQSTWSTLPRRGEVFDVALDVLEPQSHHRGLRRSRDLAQQVVDHLQRMEERYLADRQ